MNRDIDIYEVDYNNLPFEAEQASLRRISVLEIMNREKPEYILEVGCGMCPIFSDFIDFKLMTVVDPSYVFAESANKIKNDLKVNNVEVINTYLEGADLTGRKYDMILLVGLLHEVGDPKEFLRTAVDLGESGTKYLINVPNEQSFHRKLAVKLGLIKLEGELSDQQKLLQQTRIFNTTTLTEILEDAGLRILDMRSIIFKPLTHVQMQKLIDLRVLSREQVHALCSMIDCMNSDVGSELIAIAEKI